jgi:hypothetical protein
VKEHFGYVMFAKEGGRKGGRGSEGGKKGLKQVSQNINMCIFWVLRMLIIFILYIFQ